MQDSRSARSRNSAEPRPDPGAPSVERLNVVGEASAALAGVVGVTALVHAGPALAGVSPIGMRVTPSLVGRGRPGHVALTFDDGPDPASTPEFLTVLDGLGWRATFFMLGTRARRSPGLVADVVAAGHEVAVHGDEHRNMLRRTPWGAADDIRRCRDTLSELSGATPVWFRPPFGILSYGALRGARRAGLTTVLWTTWGRDWREAATPETVAADVMRRYVDGGTVLLHDVDGESYPGSWRSALGALPLLADEFAARGLVVGPLGDHGIPGRVEASV
jgi:peptidoglycan/xylan/chitin deacetylase (PgdA/CDA1 family)